MYLPKNCIGIKLSSKTVNEREIANTSDEAINKDDT